jgi:thioredoxin-like negative regulator of GroEL
LKIGELALRTNVSVRSLRIMSMPTIIVFHNGVPVDKLVGLRQKDVYQKVIARYI